MSNPWNKKNPLLSMWLSGANAVWGFARARAIVEARRQAATIQKEGVRQMIQFWSGATTARASRKKRKPR